MSDQFAELRVALSLFDTAAQAHGWASDMGTQSQAKTAFVNYQQARAAIQAAIDAQAAEIERLTRALRVAVLALAHATQEHGAIYQPAYKAVDEALSQGEPT